MEKASKVPALIAAPLLLAHEAAYLTTYDTVTISVEDKNSVFDQNTAPDEGYTPINSLVYTPQEVFQVGADWRSGAFTAADRYNSIKPGLRYRVRVAGWRIPAINWYRNIVRIEETHF